MSALQQSPSRFTYCGGSCGETKDRAKKACRSKEIEDKSNYEKPGHGIGKAYANALVWVGRIPSEKLGTVF